MEALYNLKTSPMYNLNSPRSYGPAVVECTSVIINCQQQAIFNPLLERFQQMFAEPVINQADREELYTRFHAMRIDPRLAQTITSKIPTSATTSPRVPTFVYQCFLRLLLESLQDTYKIPRPFTRHTTLQQQSRTSIEEGVLYYVSNYMTSRAMQKKNLNKEVIKACQMDSA